LTFDEKVKMVAPEVLRLFEEMAEHFNMKSKMYGTNYGTAAKVMTILFPDGITLKTEEDFIKFDFMHWSICKLTRFAPNLDHEDSIHDLAVYSTMMTAWIRVQEASREHQCSSQKDQEA
jgi:hypothetical protein